jgi:hypothetical protein
MSMDGKTVASIIYLYPNISAFLFNKWHWNGGKKTQAGRLDLIQDVLGHKDFKKERTSLALILTA